METRINVHEKGQKGIKALYAMNGYLNQSAIEPALRHLIEFRVSQINSCAFCLDMHYKDAREIGETEQRLYGLSAWRESPYYSARERAALAWAEAVTKCSVSDRVYDDASNELSEQEMIDLTFVVTSINTWNRLNHAFPVVVGNYKVGQFA